MKTRDIANKYKIDQAEFVRFLYRHPELSKTGSFGSDIADAVVPELVEKFKAEFVFLSKKKEEEQAERLKIYEEKEEEKKKRDFEYQNAIASMLITSGFSFEGYRITKYSGYISGDDAVEIPRSGWLFTQKNSKNLTDALVKIRIQALKELKEAAYDLGCNAIIGVDFDYITLEPEHGSGLYNGVPGAGTVYEPYIICVTANGNAVVIEKE